MTNPNDAIGTNGAFGGRTSVNAFNDVLATFQGRGVLNGWGIVPSSGMTVACGGDGTNRDVAIAEDTNGNKTTINNISGAPILVTLDSAPASNSRYDAIVAYVDKPPTGNATQDNPECCGIIKVTGTAASTPTYPDDNAIRTAITADGASGATAYYAVIGYVLVASGTTTITSSMVYAVTGATITSDKIDYTNMQFTMVDSNNRVGIYFPDGTLIAYRKVSGTVSISTLWGNLLYRGQIMTGGTGTSLAPSTGDDFVSEPTVSVNVTTTSNSAFMTASFNDNKPVKLSGGAGRWGIKPGGYALIRPSAASDVPYTVDIIAVGRWKAL